MEALKIFFGSIGKWINTKIVFITDHVGWLGVGAVALVLLILLLAIIIPIIVVKKRKKKALKKAQEEQAKKKQAEQPKQEQPTETAEPIVEETVAPVEEKVEETAVAEQPVEETAEEKVETEEQPAEAVEEAVEEKAEEPKETKPKSKPKTKKTAPVVVAPVEDKAEEQTEETASEPKTENTKGEKTMAKAPAKAKTEKKRPVGKWTVEIKSEGEYLAKLSASNGEVMLSSEIYTTEDGARKGIDTIIKNIEADNFSIYQDKDKDYFYKLKTANNKLLCVGEIYDSKTKCAKSIESVKRIASDAVIDETLVEGTKYVDYTPIKNPKYEVKKGATGKWKIEQTEDGKFSAKLYASNGQLMIATEEVNSATTAKNAMKLVIENSAEGHFIIDRDKFGRFYYKLRNAQKQMICIGEAYDKLDSCTSALESVRRFAQTAVLVED